jgi:hypothetical protein
MRARWTAIKVTVAILAGLTITWPVCAQSSPTQEPVVQMEFSHPDVSPSHWTLIIHPDGSGHFNSERKNKTAETTRSLDAPDIDREIRLSKDFAAHVFTVARQRNGFRMDCESPQKVAFMGWKKLSYSGSEGHGACQFNYSTDKEIQALGASLIAVAGTIIEGARLEMLLQHDRLGLDQEMQVLIEDADAGRAQQLFLIRRVLEQLAEDPGVLERVRKRAKLLLAKAGE